MQKYALYYLVILFSTMLLSSCQAIETIFKAGMWWAFILVIGGCALIFWILSKFKK